MNFLKSFLCVSLAGLMALVTSCAKEQTESYDEFETMALKAWIYQHRNDLKDNLQQPGGYYVDVLDAGDPDRSPINEEACWVRFTFSGRDLGGNVVLTRQADDAILEGTFTKYTRYVPFYRYCGTENTSLLEGTYLAMRNKLTLGEEYFDKYKNDPGRRLTSREVLLREGSKVVLYLPSSVVGSGGVSGTGGYEGQYELSSRRPMIVTMEIRDTVKNPLEVEGTDVDAFCDGNGGLRIYAKETEETKSVEDKGGMPTDPTDERHPYNVAQNWVSASDTIPQLYINYRYTPQEKLDFENPYFSGYEPYKNSGSVASINEQIDEALKTRFYPDEDKPYESIVKLDADSVKLDGTAKIWYIGRFLDGFIFDTNIDEVKKIIYGEVKSTGTALSYKPEEGGLIQAFYYTIPHMKYGQWGALITTSTYGYGVAGKTGTSSTSGGGSSSNNSYLDYMNYMNYMNSYYGNSYNNGYYGNYYGNYGGMGGYGYGGYYGNYGYGSGYDNSSTGTEATVTTVSTEIPAYTPLIFQFYIEPKE